MYCKSYDVILNSRLFSFQSGLRSIRYTRRVGSPGKFAVVRDEPETKNPQVEEKECAAGQEVREARLSYVFLVCEPNYRVFDVECDNTYRR